MIKAVLFDADGVLIQHEMLFSKRFAVAQGIDTAEMLPFFKNEFSLCKQGKADLKEVVLPYLSAWKWTDGVEAFCSFWFADLETDTDVVAEVQGVRRGGVTLLLGKRTRKISSEGYS